MKLTTLVFMLWLQDLKMMLGQVLDYDEIARFLWNHRRKVHRMFKAGCLVDFSERRFFANLFFVLQRKHDL